jgi:hypothetical protein
MVSGGVRFVSGSRYQGRHSSSSVVMEPFSRYERRSICLMRSLKMKW